MTSLATHRGWFVRWVRRLPGRQLWAAEDRANDALQMAEEAISHWPTTPFLLQHYLHLGAALQAELYAGDTWGAWRRIRQAWPMLRRSHIMMVAIGRVDLRELRAR